MNNVYDDYTFPSVTILHVVMKISKLSLVFFVQFWFLGFFTSIIALAQHTVTSSALQPPSSSSIILTLYEHP